MGRHACVAEPLIDGCRTDLAFTLFLSDPADYDRGDLIVESNTGCESRKHAAGDLLLYPARYVHSVAPVTRGTRLVAVGWVESLTPSAERREILGDLDAALARLDAPCGRGDARLRIENARGQPGPAVAEQRRRLRFAGGARRTAPIRRRPRPPRHGRAAGRPSPPPPAPDR